MTIERHTSTDSQSEALQTLETLARGPLTLGLLIRAIRRGEHMSQADFARQLGISRSHLATSKRGVKPSPPSVRRAMQRSLDTAKPSSSGWPCKA